MTSIAEIGIRVDSSEAVQAAEDLDKLAQSGARTEKAVKSIADSSGKLEQSSAKAAASIKGQTRDVDEAAESFKRLYGGTSAASAGFFSLGNSIKNGNFVKSLSATQEADKWLASLSATTKEAGVSFVDANTKLTHLSSGLKGLGAWKGSGAPVFEQITAKSREASEGLGVFDKSATQTQMSAKAMQAALRGVPAQFTDIFTSLQGGQAPMTVLIQQGGQLKDMFGGIGPAAKAMGGYVAGLINPFTLAAAAAVGLGVAYYKGAEESTRFKTALILTGNAAGTSADSLASMASKVSETVGTTGAAADALAQLAGSGKIASGSFEEVATAALSMEKATGKAVADTIAEFVKIGKDPVSAAKELNDQYGFLTASVYAQIVSLKEQGREQEAVKLLTDTYADTVQGRSKQVVENLGLWERAWNGVKSAASGALDDLKSVGRDATLGEQLADAESRLAQLTANGRDAAKEDPFRYEAVTKEITRLKLALQANAMDQATAGLRGQNQKEAIASIDLISKEADGAATNVEKLRKRLEKLGEARTKSIANNSFGADEQAKYEKAAAALKKKIADDEKKSNKTAASAVDLSSFNDAQNKRKLITSEYDNAQQKLNAAQKSGLLSQKDYSEQSAALVEQEKGRVTAAYQAEIDALEAAKGKKSTSAEQRIALDQKIADARTNMVKAQQDADTQLNVLSTNEEGRLKKQAAAVQTYIDALDDQLATTKKQLALSVSGVGMGDEARKRLQEDIKIQQEYQDKLDKLLAQKNKNQIDEGVYQQETAAVREALAQRLAMQKDYYGAVEAEQTNWLNGASSAYATYLEQVKDVAGQTKSAFTSAFKSLEDVLVSFATTGKASFKDFADSIIADFARIVIKSKVMPAILGAVGMADSSSAGASMFGGSGGSGGPGGAGLSDIASYGTKAYGFLKGTGSELYSAYQTGGMNGVYNYGSNAVGSMFSGSAASTYTSSVAQSAVANGAESIGSQFAMNSGASASFPGAASQSAGSAGAAQGAKGLPDAGPYVAAITGAIQGYQQAGLKGGVTGAAGAVAGYQAGAAIGSLAGPVGTVIGAALGAMLGGKLGSSIWGGSWQTKDQGIQLGVEGGDFAGQQYEYQKKKGGLFGKNKKRTRLSALDPEMQKSLDSAYNATESSVLTLFDRLNVKLNDGVLDGLNIASQQISTKDKTADQIQAEITKWFAGVSDFMTVAVANATGSGTAGYDFKALTEFVNNLYGVNDVLKHLNVGLFDISVTGGFMAEQLSAFAGGFEALKTSTATYYENFFTDAEKSANTLSDVRKEFESLGLVLPESRKGYREMVEGIDKTTEAGRAMFVTLTGLSGDAAQAFTILEANADKAKQTLADMLNSAVTGASGLVQRSVNAEKDAATKAYNARMTSLNDMSETAQKSVSDMTGVSNSLENALKSLRGTSDDAVKMLRSQAQATLQSALATARAGGSLAGFTGLEDALSTVSTNNTDLYASLEDFNREQGRTANVVAELNALNGKQLTSAEQLLESIKDQIKQEKDQFDLQIEKFDEQLKLAQTQIDALNGIDNSVISVAAAMSGLSTAITAALAAKPAGSAVANTSANNSTLLDTVYQSVLGREADSAGAAYWGGLLQSGTIDYAGLVDAITKDAKANGEIKGHATGGLISGPGTGTSDSIIRRLSNGEYVLTANAVRTYGTDLLDQMNAGNLPTLAGGSAQVRTYSASRTAEALSGSGDSAAAIAELRRQLAEIYSGLAIMNKHMEKTAYNTSEMNDSGVQIVNTVKMEPAK